MLLPSAVQLIFPNLWNLCGTAVVENAITCNTRASLNIQDISLLKGITIPQWKTVLLPPFYWYKACNVKLNGNLIKTRTLLNFFQHSSKLKSVLFMKIKTWPVKTICCFNHCHGCSWFLGLISKLACKVCLAIDNPSLVSTVIIVHIAYKWNTEASCMLDNDSYILGNVAIRKSSIWQTALSKCQPQFAW